MKKIFIFICAAGLVSGGFASCKNKQKCEAYSKAPVVKTQKNS